jgi:hypothetical protein
MCATNHEKLVGGSTAKSDPQELRVRRVDVELAQQLSGFAPGICSVQKSSRVSRRRVTAGDELEDRLVREVRGADDRSAARPAGR